MNIADALCRQSNPMLWFPERGESSQPAKMICRRCPVAAACAQAALDGDERHGIWAGVSVHSEDDRLVKLRRIAAGEPPWRVLKASA